jgi:hypothetical protein
MGLVSMLYFSPQLKNSVFDFWTIGEDKYVTLHEITEENKEELLSIRGATLSM